MKRLRNLTWKGSREKPIVLDAFWSEDFDSHSVVIFAHGYKGFKDWGAWDVMAERFAEKGYLFIKFNFSFNGGTPEEPIDFPDLDAFGNNNYSTEVADFKRVIDFVHTSNTLPKNKIKLSDLAIVGHSRGGGMAILTAHQDDRVKRLITLASISNLESRQKEGDELEDWKRTGVRFVENGRTKQKMPHFFQFYEDYLENKKNLDILRSAEELRLPWLIIHGYDDKAVPFSEGEELKSVQPAAELFGIEQCNHVFQVRHPWKNTEIPEQFESMLDKSLAFLNKGS